MKRFFNDIKKYKRYIIYATKSNIKTEIIDSYLGWLWIVLEPLLFMLIYTFISTVVFGRTELYLAAFIFIGLSVWKFFNGTVIASVKMVSGNKETVTKVYVPKFILLLIECFENGFKMLVSFSLVSIFMIYYHVSLTWNILYIIPLLIVLFIITFGISSFLMHFGVFVEDLNKIVPLGLRFVFYLSGVFYSLVKRVPEPYGTILLLCNPIAYIINDLRNVIIYSTGPNLIIMAFWLIIGIVLSYFGVKTIYKYENTYVKVMK